MLLKRHYDIPDGWTPEREPLLGVLLNPPPFSHLEVKHTGSHVEQNFSTKMVEAGLAEGYLSITKGSLVLHAKPEDLVYKIVRGPGYYCCHCGAALTDASQALPSGGTVGMKHVADEHPDEDSPDSGNPSGYERINHYETVLGTAQHAKFRAGAKHG